MADLSDQQVLDQIKSAMMDSFKEAIDKSTQRSAVAAERQAAAWERMAAAIERIANK